MFETRQIQISDIEEVETVRKKYNYNSSAYCFASLYLYRDYFQLTICLDKDSYFVKMGKDEDNTWFFPCGSLNKIKCFIDSKISENNFKLVYLSANDKNMLEENYPGKFIFVRDEASDEYIYCRDEQQKLYGTKFAKVRKVQNKLLKEYKVDIVKVYSSAILEKEMSKIIDKKEYREEIEKVILNDAIKHMERLKLFGIIVYLNDVVSAFSLGYEISENLLDGCIEFHLDGIDGLSCFVQRALLLNAPEQYRYMNGEESLGLQGLERAKRNMGPCSKIEMWSAICR